MFALASLDMGVAGGYLAQMRRRDAEQFGRLCGGERLGVLLRDGGAQLLAHEHGRLACDAEDGLFGEFNEHGGAGFILRP